MPGHLTDNASHTRNSKRCNPTRGRGVVLENETTKIGFAPERGGDRPDSGRLKRFGADVAKTTRCIKGTKGLHDESESSRGKGNYRQHAWVRRPRTVVGCGERRTDFAERAADTVATRWPWPRTLGRRRRRLGRRRRRRKLGRRRRLGWAWLGRRARAIRLHQRGCGHRLHLASQGGEISASDRRRPRHGLRKHGRQEPIVIGNESDPASPPGMIGNTTLDGLAASWLIVCVAGCVSALCPKGRPVFGFGANWG